MKKFILLMLFTFTIIPLGHSQSRSPAVEPQRQIINQNSTEYKDHPGFQFKNGQPVSTTSSQPEGTGVYAVLFMLALASMPFLMHVIFKGNVVPVAKQEENATVEAASSTTETTTEAPVTSLKDFRDNKSSETTETVEDDGEIKKAS
jgi:hypothetical protein